jgi:hypothetical protein
MIETDKAVIVSVNRERDCEFPNEHEHVNTNTSENETIEHNEAYEAF